MDCSSNSNFEEQIILESKRQQEVQCQLAEKRAALDLIEEELPLHVLKQQMPHDEADEEFCGMANEAFKLRAEILEQVWLFISAYSHMYIF